MSLVEEKKKLIRLQSLQIQQAIHEKFYKKGRFWVSVVSAIIALSSAGYVAFDYFKGNEKTSVCVINRSQTETVFFQFFCLVY